MRRRQAFTLVEVMVGIGVMTVAALALFALMQQLMKANAHARRLTVATQISQDWIERLKMDALRWNVAGNPSNTTWLKEIKEPGEFGKFINFKPQTPTRGTEKRVISNAYDWFGEAKSIADDGKEGLAYCASYRLNWVFENKRVIRADVRVWWARDGYVDEDMKGVSIVDDYPDCQDDNDSLNPDGKNYDRYHVVYLSTVLRAAL